MSVFRSSTKSSGYFLGRVLGILLLGMVVGGCVSLRKKGPVDQQVVAGRQLAQRGMEAIERDRWDQAEDLLRRSVEICPVDERARQHYAEALWHRGASREAISQMTEAVRLSGGDGAMIVRLGELYLASGDLVSAERRSGQAIRANPELASAWALRGDVLRLRGNDQDALASYHQSLCFQGSDGRVQLEVAEIYRRQGRPGRALSTLQSLAEEYSPGQEPQRMLLLQGLALKALGRYQDSADTLAAACQRARPTAELLYHLGEAELLAGRPARARLAAAQALELVPDHQASHALVARIQRARSE